MIVDKIHVTSDPRVERRFADINGKRYGMRMSFFRSLESGLDMRLLRLFFSLNIRFSKTLRLDEGYMS